METLPWRNKNLRGQEHIRHAIPRDERQFMQCRTRSVDSDRRYIALKRAIAALAVTVFRWLRLGRKFLG